MKSLNVLVAEDEPSNAEIVQVILESEGHQVTLCMDGTQVLDLCHRQGRRFDVILMDILMPEMDGLETTRRLRADERTRDVPIVCVSAKASGSDQEKGLAAGCTTYVTKPYKRKMLLTEIKKALTETGVLTPEEGIERS
ncbi:MAG TPA: response regulator [Stenomitos sp.]